MQLEDLPTDVLSLIMEYKQELEDGIAHAERLFSVNMEFMSFYCPDFCFWYGHHPGGLGFFDDEIGAD